MVGLSIPYWPQFSFLGQPDILVGAFKALCSLILTPNTPPRPPHPQPLPDILSDP